MMRSCVINAKAIKKATIISVILTMLSITIDIPTVEAATPSVAYLSPADGSLFADVVPGDGVNWTVNVTDSDGDLQRVVLQHNKSGSWQTFYDSGALGSVSYYNASGIHANWTGSWTKYWWRVCAYDGTWTNTTYNFTTEYVFGSPHIVRLNDYVDIYRSCLYKNNTGEYYLWYAESRNIHQKNSTNGTDFKIRPDFNTAVNTYYHYGSKTIENILYSAITYNNTWYVYYWDNDYVRHMHYDDISHSYITSSTGIQQWYGYFTDGFDIKYYDGVYNAVCGHISSGATIHRKVNHYTSSSPLNSFTYRFELHDDGNLQGDKHTYLEILNGKLVVIYLIYNQKLVYRSYDGSSWSPETVIESNIYSAATMCKDYINNQLVLIYSNSSHVLLYRTMRNLSEGWSEPHILFKPLDGCAIRYPHSEYIDRRIVVTFSYNARGSYNIYVIAAPDYADITSGINVSFNRITFPDSRPNQQHVNSTIFTIKNINDRDIKNITWHVGKIGDIETKNNVRVWSNMSGSWQSWLVGSDYNTSEIDISAVKGSEWTPGETTYWKLEILNIGSVPEDYHTSDENIWFWVDLGT